MIVILQLKNFLTDMTSTTFNSMEIEPEESCTYIALPQFPEPTIAMRFFDDEAMMKY